MTPTPPTPTPPTSSSYSYVGCYGDKQTPERVFASYSDDKEMTTEVSGPTRPRASGCFEHLYPTVGWVARGDARQLPSCQQWLENGE